VANEIRLQRLGLLHQGDSAQAGLQSLPIQGDADGQRAHGCQPIEIERRQLTQAIELLVGNADGIQFVGPRVCQAQVTWLSRTRRTCVS
jgi:hypothetical protein